jgi:hypothetical protein
MVKRAKNLGPRYPKMVNRQAKTITEALKSTPIKPLLKKANIISVIPLLNNKQRRYAARALKLPGNHSVNNLLPSTLRYEDGDAQPEEYSTTDLQWAEGDTKPTELDQRLARKLTKDLNINLSESFKRSNTPQEKGFPGQIHIDESYRAEEKTYKPREGLIL